MLIQNIGGTQANTLAVDVVFMPLRTSCQRNEIDW